MQVIIPLDVNKKINIDKFEARSSQADTAYESEEHVAIFSPWHFENHGEGQLGTTTQQMKRSTINEAVPEESQQTIKKYTAVYRKICNSP